MVWWFVNSVVLLTFYFELQTIYGFLVVGFIVAVCVMMLVLVLLVGVWFLSGFVCLDLFVVIAFAGLVYCCGGFRFLVCLLRLIVLEGYCLWLIGWYVWLLEGLLLSICFVLARWCFGWGGLFGLGFLVVEFCLWVFMWLLVALGLTFDLFVSRGGLFWWVACRFVCSFVCVACRWVIVNVARGW